MKDIIGKSELILNMFDSLPCCISYVDSKQCYRYNNACYEKWFHMKAEDCYGKHVKEILGPEGYQKSKQHIMKALSGKRVTFSAYFQTSLGSVRDVKITFFPDISKDGNCKGYIAYAVDVSEENNAIRALDSSRKQYQQLFDSTPAGMVVYEPLENDANDNGQQERDFRFLKINKAALRMSDLPVERFIGSTITEVFPYFETSWLEMLNKVHESGKTMQIEEYMQDLDHFYDVCCFKPQEGLVACSFVNITEQKKSERRYRKQREKIQSNFERVQKHLLSSRKQLKREQSKRKEIERQKIISDSIYKSSSQGVCITDENVAIIQVNPAFTLITGYSADEVIGQNPCILQSHYNHPLFYKQMWDELLDTGAWEGEIWNRRKNGETYIEYLAISTVKGKNDEILYYVAVFHDISDLHTIREEIAFNSSCDHLTGLPNRLSFVDSCNKMINYSDACDGGFALALLDIDNFKEVNEALGFTVGDVLLKQVAERITTYCRHRDTVARLGGDEFIILLDNTNDPECTIDSILLIIGRVLTTLAEAFAVDEHLISLKASIGVSLYPSHGTKSGTLLQHAEIALYQAKNLGGSRIAVFTEEAEAGVKQQIALKNQLQLALERNEFELHYQPKIRISDGWITGVEALIRWYPPNEDFVPPDDFIPLAEESDLIKDIGAWVIDESAAQLHFWQKRGWKDFSVAVNLSARQFADPNLLNLLLSAVKRHQINPEDLHLEITEHTVVEQIDKTVRTMKEITSHGFVISIDDFGTGFSSLVNLKDFPISTLKIDRSFVQNIPNDVHNITIVNLSLTLAQSLDLSVIAEGVETKDQLDLLRKLGCDEYQGYHCSHPLPAYELEDFMGAYDNWPNKQK
jgi:diguanylate cyclase (GGDEF)-like protein/PAS domain S-box-containing protein